MSTCMLYTKWNSLSLWVNIPKHSGPGSESWHKIMRWSLFVEKIVSQRIKLPCIIPIVLFHIWNEELSLSV